VGEHTIELLVEVFVKENLVLLDLIEQVKTMKGVRDLIWIEITETIGRNRLPRIQAPLFSSSSSQPLPESSGYQY